MIAVAKKESREIFRDPITLGIAILLPVIMMFLFSYAITLDVREIRLAVLDQDRSSESREYVSSFLESGYFRLTAYASNPKDIEQRLDQGTVRMALIVPPDFSTRLRQGLSSEVQTLLDGSFANTVIVASNYVAAIDEIQNARLQSYYLAQRFGPLELARAIKAEPRVRYNPGLRSANFIIPGLFAVILMAFPPMLTALAVVREKERGSIKQIFASPIKSWEFISGKMLPYTGIAFLEMLLLLEVGRLWFSVAVLGSVPLLLGLSWLYVACTVGIGLLVSTLTKSQVVAVLLAIILTLMPSFLFSGFLFPIASMPEVFRYYTYLFPARYFNEIARGIVLKGIGLYHLWFSAALLVVYAAAVLTCAAMRFSKKIG
ncbi:MAG TPA: ABC transporter permease [Candidatus Binatia bacterium]|nr:ABC transporter permease [Candidatus Binatia bacterium]